jgi:hypothetical protein
VRVHDALWPAGGDTRVLRGWVTERTSRGDVPAGGARRVQDERGLVVLPPAIRASWGCNNQCEERRGKKQRKKAEEKSRGKKQSTKKHPRTASRIAPEHRGRRPPAGSPTGRERPAAAAPPEGAAPSTDRRAHRRTGPPRVDCLAGCDRSPHRGAPWAQARQRPRPSTTPGARTRRTVGATRATQGPPPGLNRERSYRAAHGGRAAPGLRRPCEAGPRCC